MDLWDVTYFYVVIKYTYISTYIYIFDIIVTDSLPQLKKFINLAIRNSEVICYVDYINSVNIK